MAQDQYRTDAMLTLAEKLIKTVTTVFHMFKKQRRDGNLWDNFLTAVCAEGGEDIYICNR